MLILVVFVAFAFLKWPHYFINEKNLRVMASFASRFGTSVSWNSADIQIHSQNLLHKRFDFSFEGLCFNFSNNQQQGCFDKFRVAADVAWLHKRFQILEMGPIQILGGKVAFTYQPSQEKKNSLELDLPELILPSLLQQTSFQELSIGLDEIVIWTNGEPVYSGRAYLWGEINERGDLDKMKLDASLDERPATPSGKVSFEIASASHFRENDWLLKGNASGSVQDSKMLAFLEAHPMEAKIYDLNVEGEWIGKKDKAKANLNMRLAKGLWQGRFSAATGAVVKPIQKIQAQDCSFSLKEIEAKRDRLHLSLDCPVLVDLTPMKLPSSSYERFVTVPYNLDLRVKSDLETSFFPSPAEPLDGKLEIELNTISQELLNFKGKTSTRFAGIPSKYPEGWTLETDLDLQAVLPQFKRWVRAMEKTAFPVFAPLNNLDGSVELKVAGKADLARQKGSIPLEFKSNLKSAEQSFVSQGKGDVTYQVLKKATETQVNFDFVLDDVKLVMPHLGYTTLPTLFPDARFVDPRKKVAAAANKHLKYQLSLRTPADKPARLVSNLTKDSIPLYFDLNMNEKKLGGNIRVGSTQIDFFRRNATVEKFNLTLAEPSNKSVVDGLLRVKYADYTIDIIVVGAIERPKIIFQSDPPLEQDQILSVLIYGRTFEDLDNQNSSSVTAVSTAIADRALALGSLFLLASSPVESIRYDPSSRAFSAKIKLAQGTSIDLGTHEGKTQEVGFRKSLKGNWLIRTYFTNDPQANTQKGGALLEWHKRY